MSAGGDRIGGFDSPEAEEYRRRVASRAPEAVSEEREKIRAIVYANVPSGPTMVSTSNGQRDKIADAIADALALRAPAPSPAWDEKEYERLKDALVQHVADCAAHGEFWSTGPARALDTYVLAHIRREP